MRTELDRASLVSDLRAAESLLARARGLARVTLEARCYAIRQELLVLDSAVRSEAEALVSFSGDAVVGSYGIDAAFAGDAIAKLDSLVGRVAAATFAQPQQGERAPRLLITAMPRGSVGFRLEEAQTSMLIDSSLEESLEAAAGLLEVAADGDRDLEEAVSFYGRQVHVALRNFLVSLKEHRSSLQLSTRSKTLDLGVRAVALAADRVRAVQISEQQETREGFLTGVFGKARQFEFTPLDGEPIRGRIGAELSAEELETHQSVGMKQLCTVVLNVTRARHAGKLQRHYTLRSVVPTVPDW